MLVFRKTPRVRQRGAKEEGKGKKREKEGPKRGGKKIEKTDRPKKSNVKILFPILGIERHLKCCSIYYIKIHEYY